MPKFTSRNGEGPCMTSLGYDLAKVRTECLAAGFQIATIQEWERKSRLILGALGFADAHEVRRIADRFGVRKGGL